MWYTHVIVPFLACCPSIAEENLAAIRLEGGIPKTIAILNPTEDPAVLLQALKLAMLFATTGMLFVALFLFLFSVPELISGLPVSCFSPLSGMAWISVHGDFLCRWHSTPDPVLSL